MADRIIIATARAHSCPLLTVDDKILAYPHAHAVHPRTLSAAKKDLGSGQKRGFLTRRGPKVSVSHFVSAPTIRRFHEKVAFWPRL